MLRVLTKTATFVENIWHGAGQEILIAEHHFSEEVHVLLETLGIEKEPVPIEPLSPPAIDPTPIAAIPSAEPSLAAISEPTAATEAAPENPT